MGYEYELEAVETVQPAGGSSFTEISPLSLVLTATTAPSGSTADNLSATAVALYLTENSPFSGTVATFTDTNSSRTASSFIATVIWGDSLSTTGSVSESAGVFSVSAGHTYSASGNFNIQIQIKMVTPYTGTASTVSTAVVSQPLIEIGLSGAFNEIGITTDNDSSVAGQLGTSGNASYSWTALGANASNTIYWNSNPYLLGSPNVADAIKATGQYIGLNCGNCTGLDILATATGASTRGACSRSITPTAPTTSTPWA